MKFRVENVIFDRLPDYVVGVVCARGLDNSVKRDSVRELLDREIEQCASQFQGKKAKNLEEVEPYRGAFREIGINPNRYQCSIEALMDRICQGKGMPHINDAVDLGNAVSLHYHLPIGAHDAATFRNDTLEVRFSAPEDTFIPFGGGEDDPPKELEAVYVSGKEVRTRRWTWRQSEIGKITENTTDILYPIDGFQDCNEEEVKEAAEKLASLLREEFGAEVVTGLVDREHPEFEAKF